MKPQVKTALLIALVSLNIATLGLAAGSSIYLLKKGVPAAAAEESAQTAEVSGTEESSAPDGGIEDPEDVPEDEELEEGEYEEHASREDGVTIGGQYQIRSTLEISDAYKAGDPSGLSDADRETYDMASKLLSEIITDGMTDYEKEKAVYDWMTANLSFDQGSLTVISTAGAEVDHPHGVLRSHQAVCVGFATTFRLLMQMMDIDCKVVHDRYRGHSWDCVKIGEHWYFVDIYSDIGSGNYAHFNLTSALFSTDHDWDQDFFPTADSLEYNPAYMARVKADDVYGIPAAMRTVMDEMGGSLVVEFADNKLSEAQIGVIENMFSAIDDSGDAFYSSDAVSKPMSHCVFEDPATHRDMLFVYFYVETQEGGPSYDISDEELEKANEALNDAFGDLGSVVIY